MSSRVSSADVLQASHSGERAELAKLAGHAGHAERGQLDHRGQRSAAREAVHGALPQLDLCFAQGASGATYLSRQHSGYPFHVGRVLAHPEYAGRARVIVQSSSGGLFENERVSQRLVAAPGASAEVKTAAATIVHSMTGAGAFSHCMIEAQAGARLDVLPRTTILFPAAQLTSTIEVIVHPGAAVVVSDAYLIHDPSGLETTFGLLDASIIVRDAQRRLLAKDHFRLHPDVLAGSQHENHLQSSRGFGGRYAAQGGLMVLVQGSSAGALAAALAAGISKAVHELALERTLGYAGASVLPGQCGIVVRVLAADSHILETVLSVALATVGSVLERDVASGALMAAHGPLGVGTP